MSAREAAPFPNASTAFTLAATALFTTALVASVLAERPVVGSTLGSVVGLGGIGLFAARLVPEPAPARLGMAPFPLRALVPLLLLVPFAFLVSELDNWIRLAFAAPPAEQLGVPQTPAPEAALFTVLLHPALNEFFFRGVLLQGCALRFSRWRAVLYVAALEIVLMPTFVLVDSFTTEPRTALLVSATASTFLTGALLGIVRLATGSLLPAIALSGGFAASSVAAAAFPDRLAIPGFNAPGDTTPPAVLVPAAASVALGFWLLLRQLAREPELPPIPPPKPEDEKERGPLL